MATPAVHLKVFVFVFKLVDIVWHPAMLSQVE